MSKVNILWNFANHLASACSAIMLGFMVYVRSGSNFQYTYATHIHKYQLHYITSSRDEFLIALIINVLSSVKDFILLKLAMTSTGTSM